MPRCPSCHRRIPEATPCPLDGSIAPPWVVPADVAGAEAPKLPDFTLGEQLGMGGFSIVWSAVRDSDGAPAAVKVGRGDSPNTGERFRRDAEALARLGPPHAPRLFRSGRLDDGRPYIAMELLIEPTLAARLEGLPAPPDVDWVAHVARAILNALGMAHARGILHRDLKPENIFLDEAGTTVTLIDFGLTKSTASEEVSGLTRAGTIVGTPEYMAPEQVRGDTAMDARTDIYSFGVILYELCTLRLPFTGDRGSIEHGHLAMRPPRPRLFAAIPEALEELVLACLAKEPERRPASVAAVHRALLDACPPAPASDGARPRARASTIPPPGSRPSSSRVRLLAEGRRPMVVLVADSSVAAPQVTAAVTRRGGFVARQRGSTYVCVFSGVDVENPAQAAIAAARDMVARFGARAALHLASLAMRRQENAPPAVYGAPVDRPETWLPAEVWSGIMVTADLARAVPEAELGPAPEGAAFYPLAPVGPPSFDPASLSGVQPRSGRAAIEPEGQPPRSRPGGRSRAASSPDAPASQRAPRSRPWSPPSPQPSSDAPASPRSPWARAQAQPMTQRSPNTPPPPPPLDPAGESPSSQPTTQPSTSLSSEQSSRTSAAGDPAASGAATGVATGPEANRSSGSAIQSPSGTAMQPGKPTTLSSGGSAVSSKGRPVTLSSGVSIADLLGKPVPRSSGGPATDSPDRAPADLPGAPAMHSLDDRKTEPASGPITYSSSIPPTEPQSVSSMQPSGPVTQPQSDPKSNWPGPSTRTASGFVTRPPGGPDSGLEDIGFAQSTVPPQSGLVPPQSGPVTLAPGGARATTLSAGMTEPPSGAGVTATLGGASTYPPSEARTSLPSGVRPVAPGIGSATTQSPASGKAPPPGNEGSSQPLSQPPRSLPATVGPVSITHRFPLFGRDATLASIQASVVASFDGSCPGLFTLLGDSGLGKTRLTAEALTVVDRLRPGLTVIYQRSAQPLAGAAGQTTRELLGRVLGADPAGPPPDDPRAFCRGRLGEELGEEVWPAVAVALGWSAAEAVGVTPGALQRGTMLALNEGLRRLSRAGPVALVLDDAHWADDTALDALEYATLNAVDSPLWVMVAAHPRFENVRRGWGSRAQRHDREVLGPLDVDAGMQLAAELLLPAEYPPAATLKRLAEWAGGNPACLAELARTLKRAGIVRQRPNLGTWYVATAELDRLPPSPAWQWLAVRQLDALQPELAACVRLCSVFGVEFSREEVEWVQDAMERAGAAGTTIDMGVGLRSLVERRILVRGSGDRYSFQSSTFQDAVYKLLDPSHREQIHRHAFEFWRSELGEGGVGSLQGLLRLGRHAGACGAREEAAEAYLLLGDAARAGHRHVEADQHYTSALAFVGEGDARRRAQLLSGRGKIRYRVHRIREALEDLRAARELAGMLGDDEFMADLLLEEATALDFANDFVDSAKRVEDARSVVERLGDPRLRLRFSMALGRSFCRQERTPEAIELLGRSADGAEASGDYETRVISLLVLSPLLVAAGCLDEAEARFSEVIALCTKAEDWLHLGAAYANRAFLWVAQKLLDRCMDDLRRAIQLAREVGNPWSELIATYNVAEFLHWLGEEEEALVLAQRGRVLEERFTERPVPEGSLLLARIQAARGEYEEVNRLIAWIGGHCPIDASEPTMLAFFNMLRLVLKDVGVLRGESKGASIQWDDVVAQAGGASFAEELLEVLYWRARVALGNERWEEAEEALAQAEQRLDECPMWRLRFASLAMRLTLRQPASVTSDRLKDSLSRR